jgi:hypothetical protein
VVFRLPPVSKVDHRSAVFCIGSTKYDDFRKHKQKTSKASMRSERLEGRTPLLFLSFPPLDMGSASKVDLRRHVARWERHGFPISESGVNLDTTTTVDME